MITLKDLQEQADRVAEKIGLSVTFEIEYWNHGNESISTTYKLRVVTIVGVERDYSIDCDTAQDLMQAMDRILTPVEDMGVLLESEAA